MNPKNPASLRLLAGVTFLLACASAQAQATRTWVSGVGNDANPCSRTAPCKTFAGAISKTAAGGIISVLDPGGFGAVTITKSITLDGGGFDASILASGTTGVLVNGANITVTLRNLNINGSGFGTSPGINGVRFYQGAALHVENCVITGFKAAGSNANGILVDSPYAGTMRLYVRDSTITDSGNGTDGGGIRFKQTPAYVYASVVGSEIGGHAGYGIRVGDRVFLTVEDTNIAGTTGSGINLTTTADISEVVVRNSVLSDNGLGTVSDAGIYINGINSTARLAGNLITQSDRGVHRVSNGKAYSAGDNRLFGNTTNGTVNGPDTSL
jgi:hypothetical protein